MEEEDVGWEMGSGGGAVAACCSRLSEASHEHKLCHLDML